jgi:hypothetical protein
MPPGKNQNSCPKCEAWVSTRDRFCGVCGKALTGIQMSLLRRGTSSHKPVDGLRTWRADKAPGDLILKLFNCGYQSVTLEDFLTITPEDAVSGESLDDLRISRTLDAARELELPLVMSPEWLKSVTSAQQITVRLADRDRQSGESVSFRIIPAPELEYSLLADPFQVVLDGKEDEKLEIQVISMRGCCRIKELPRFSTSHTWLQIQESTGSTRILDADSPGSTYKFHIVFNEKGFLESTGEERSLKPEIQLEWQDDAGQEMEPLVITPTIELVRPQRIRHGFVRPDGNATGHLYRVRHEAVAGVDDSGLRLRLYNDGDSVLSVRRMDFTEKDLCTLMAAPSQFPLRIDPGGKRILGLRFHLESYASISATKTIPFHFSIESDDPLTPRANLQVDLELSPLEDLEDTLVMDFGTIGSVIGHQAGILHDESIADSSGTVPTSIYYRNRDEFQIGKLADKQGSKNPQDVQRYIKRDLCSGRNRTVLLAHLREEISLSPEDITRDYMAELFRSAQNQLKMRIGNLVLTHPVKFSLKQVQTLKEIAANCLNLDHSRLETWSEPVAGGFEYILEELEHLDEGRENRYNLLIYDFGGGTTDISLLHVTARKAASDTGERHSLAVEFLGITGDLALGGVDQTRELSKHLEECIQKEFEQWVKLEKGKEHAAFRLPFSGSPDSTQKELELAYQNKRNLEELAEQYKVARSLIDARNGVRWKEEQDLGSTVPLVGKLERQGPKGKGWVETIEPPRDRFSWINGKTTGFAFKQLWITVDSVVAHRLCESRIRRCVEKAGKLCQQAGILDGSRGRLIVLPIGGASAYPLLMELLKERFDKEKAVEVTYPNYSPERLKTCITEGLCRLIREEMQLDFDRSGLHVNCRAIGWTRSNGSFEELIPIGEPLPRDKEALTYRWKPYPVSPRIRVVKLWEVLDSVPEPGDTGSSPQVVRQIALDGHFTQDELRGLEVGAAFDTHGELRVCLRTGGVDGRIVDPDGLASA